ncbi:MAG: MmcQ/YjbR family DNA-binding protein [Bifidobacteriaceae bacterium]|jgi:predicted DNA-binding protein (MmcQ/YjbR family)|nr:MmcQ/YjbR family DNA-binding protein [Bifidobacteriaceae bacterium]
MQREELIDFVRSEFGVEPEYSFAKFPRYAALKHPGGKWFGLIMNVPRKKVGLAGDGRDPDEEIDIADFKIDPELNSALRRERGYLPGYHMSKEHWISVILADFDHPEDLRNLIDSSFAMTR